MIARVILRTTTFMSSTSENDSESDSESSSADSVRVGQTSTKCVYVCRGCNVFSSPKLKAIRNHCNRSLKCKRQIKKKLKNFEPVYSKIKIRTGPLDHRAGGQSRPRIAQSQVSRARNQRLQDKISSNQTRADDESEKSSQDQGDGGGMNIVVQS